MWKETIRESFSTGFFDKNITVVLGIIFAVGARGMWGGGRGEGWRGGFLLHMYSYLNGLIESEMEVVLPFREWGWEMGQIIVNI